MNLPTHRIIYLDILRVFAILLMLQGHTVHTLLAEQYKNMDSIVYSSWYILRGFTAPIFMFTAGVVFTYLLTTDEFSLNKNSRILKGIQRGVSLILIGYLLRYPAYKIFDFSDVTSEQWLIYFSVDALHLIGFGLLLIIFFEWFSLLSKINNTIIFSLCAIIILIASPFINSLNWGEYLPIPFASYFTFEYGSIFPLFPYLQYIFAGAVIGSILSRHPNFYKIRSANFVIFFVGILLVIFSRYIYLIFENQAINDYSQSLNRIGVVLILNSIFALIAIKIELLPRYLLLLAKNSLLIYIIHLVILYGSPWSLGLYHLIGESFSVSMTIVSTLIMITLMILISLRIDKFRIRKRKVVN